MIEPNFDPLITNKNAAVIFDLFAQIGHEIRFVGGAVRDALARRRIGDIDLATPLRPEAVMSAFEEVGIKVIPTGIDYGTVTVVINGESFEITTLRKDVSTDGRRAVVAYTHDWYEDACRRDFTINAMSLKRDGTLFDPFEGRDDIEKKRIVFIGPPKKRIEEDVLRILRFFRFQAFFGDRKPHGPSLKACIDQRALLTQLSSERVRNEIFKLLESPRAAQIWQMMLDGAILTNVLPHASRVETLARLIRLEEQAGVSDVFRRMLSLYDPDDIVLSDLTARLAFSKHEKARVALYKKKVIPETLSCHQVDDFLPYLYHYGRRITLDGLLINRAHTRPVAGAVDREIIKDCVHMVQNWQKPVFPLSGHDIIKHFGLKEGPEIGVFLRDIEEYWLDKDTRPSREDLLIVAKSLFAKPGMEDVLESE